MQCFENPLICSAYIYDEDDQGCQKGVVDPEVWKGCNGTDLIEIDAVSQTLDHGERDIIVSFSSF